MLQTKNRNDLKSKKKIPQRNEAGFTGGTITYTNYVPSLFPAPMIPQSPGKITSGDGHFLTPVFVIPTRGGSDLSMSSFGKIPYLYRTTDDLAEGSNLYYTLTRDDSASSKKDSAPSIFSLVLLFGSPVWSQP